MVSDQPAVVIAPALACAAASSESAMASACARAVVPVPMSFAAFVGLTIFQIALWWAAAAMPLA